MDEKQGKREQQQTARRSVRPGDSLYYSGAGGLGHGRVVCHGKHGVTLDIEGKHTPVRWEHVLGHKERMGYRAKIVDQGEDGAVVEEPDGTRSFIEGLFGADDGEEKPEPEPKPAWETVLKKAVSTEPEPRALFVVLSKAARAELTRQATDEKSAIKNGTTESKTEPQRKR